MTHQIEPLLQTAIERLAAIPQLQLREQEPLASHVSMGVGGPARWFAVAEDEPALTSTLAVLRESGIPWLVLGGGSNTVFTEKGFHGLVLMLGRGFRKITYGPATHQLTAGASAPLSAVMNAAKRAGLAGLEWAAGVPGTLGGALAGNAGTPAGEICPQADAVEVIDAAGQRLTRPRGGFGYGYRKSELKRDLILGATLALTPDAPEAIQARINAALAKRMTQPVGERCSGCMFKNPPDDFAGRLIDTAGLKGLRVGGARVSERHANFMINDGSATAEDLRRLVELVQERVRERHHVNLELEVRMVGLDFLS